MATPRLFEDCQAWIERGHESWKSYFSKWEAFAKYEENIPENELVHELYDGDKTKKNRSKKRTKHSLRQKRPKTELFKGRRNKQKKFLNKERNSQKTETETRNKKQSEENTSEIVENTQLEITLRKVFAAFLKANRNKFEMFTVLFQTYSGQEVTFKNSHCSFHGQKQRVLPCSGFEVNLAGLSFEKQQPSSSSPAPKFHLNDRSICPARDVYIQSFCENSEEMSSSEIEWNQHGSPRTGARDTKYAFARSSFKNNSSKQLFLTPLNGGHTPPLIIRQNMHVRSCSPSNPGTFRFKNFDLKSVHSSEKFPSNLCQKYLKYSPISKMSLSQERSGNSCLHKRTNSVSLGMGNSNFITPERKSSEQNHFNKIVSQRRHPSKKLFFDNEEDDDSESDDQTEYRAPLIQCPDKGLKTAEPEVATVESDSDDCQSIFSRIVRT